MKNIDAAAVNLRGAEAVQAPLEAGADNVGSSVQVQAGHPRGSKETKKGQEPVDPGVAARGEAPDRPLRLSAADGRAPCCTILT
eukprot:5131391-Amphidinium_carterae.1